MGSITVSKKALNINMKKNAKPIERISAEKISAPLKIINIEIGIQTIANFCTFT